MKLELKDHISQKSDSSLKSLKANLEHRSKEKSKKYANPSEQRVKS